MPPAWSDIVDNDHLAPRLEYAERLPHSTPAVTSRLFESLFLDPDLDQARQIITAWVADYNTTRPHSSRGYRTPAAYADHLTATGHRAALHEGSARWPVAHTAPKGVSTTEALIAAG